jgi:hypothetical protein
MATKPQPPADPKLRVPRFAELDSLIPATPAALPGMVDELIDISSTLDPFRTLIAREEALRKRLRAAADFPAQPADREIRISGSKGFVILGPRAFERVINFKLLVKKIGAVAFAKFAKCGLGDLEKNAPGLDIACVTSANTGSRSLKVFAAKAA